MPLRRSHLVVVPNQHQGGLGPALQLPDDCVEGMDWQSAALVPEITWSGGEAQGGGKVRGEIITRLV